MSDLPALLSQAPAPAIRLPGVLVRGSTDREVLSGWLDRYKESPNTFSSYRREADRLLIWCDWRNITLADLSVEDVVAFKTWLSDPQPRAQWCSCENLETKKVPARFLPDESQNPFWKPFVRPLGDAAVRQSVTILVGLFDYLCNVKYLLGNAFRASKTRIRTPRQQGVERYLEPHVFQALLDYIEGMPRATTRQEQHRQRFKFLVSMLFLLGLRQSEMANARTSDINVVRGQLWLNVLGKGQKLQPVPLNQDAVAAIKEYRLSLGLSEWPSPEEDLPLLQSIGGKGKGMTHKGVYKTVKSLLKDVAAEQEDPAIAAQLGRASTHWFRHTACTAMLESGLDLLQVRDNLRHSSVKTTELYLHGNTDKQHRATESHRLNPGKI